MIDENAFGILVAFSNIEDEEYTDEDVEPFVDRFKLFSRLVLQVVESDPPADESRALDLGHAVYIEVADVQPTPKLLSWSKNLREELRSHDFSSTVVLSHGGRWITTEGSTDVQMNRVGNTQVVSLGGPSEPLRRALFAETATHGIEDEATGWGPGLYLDTEAMEALAIHPKNEPTLLTVAGASFVRVSR
jgi:hypothetical protein